MPTKMEPHVPKSKRAASLREGTLDWEGARIFLEIGRTGSLRAASPSLRMSVNALRRRLEKLEQSVGETLLTRHIDGVRLTAEGERVLAAAKQMEAIASKLLRGDNRVESDHGPIKLAVTEGLGLSWIGPRLGEYRQAHPRQSVNLQCAMSTADILRLEADLAIQLVRPEAKDLKMVKLGRLHGMPFGSRSYIATHGTPRTVDELADHQVVFQVANQVTPEDAIPAEVLAALQHGNIAMQTNSSVTHYFAVVCGVGLGMLPTYVQSLGSALVPIDLGYRTQHDIWLVYHPDAAKLVRVQQMIEWLIELFSPRRYPWFDSKFIHPNDFPSDPQRQAGFEVIPNLANMNLLAPVR